MALVGTSGPTVIALLGLTVIVQSQVIQAKDSCKSIGGSTVAGQCLILYEDPMTWTKAVASCEAKGQRLAVLQDPVAVNVWLQNNYAGKYIWLGASDTAKEGKWVWINGQSAQSVWTSSQPNNDNNQDCLAWGWGNNYDDGWCDRSNPYICEFESKSNTCEDDSNKCAKLAAKGKCTKGSVFMKCKLSCACGINSNPKCVDTKKNCPKLAAKGKCSKSGVYTKCRASCACDKNETKEINSRIIY